MGQTVLGLLPFAVVTSERDRLVEFDRRLVGDGVRNDPALQPGIALALLLLPLGLCTGLTLEAKAHAVLRGAPDVDGFVGHRFARLAIGGFRDRAGLFDPLLLGPQRRAAAPVRMRGHHLVDALQPCQHGLRFRASVDRR